MLVAQLDVMLGQGDECVAGLRPLLGHLEEVARAAIALQGLILLGLPAENALINHVHSVTQLQTAKSCDHVTELANSHQTGQM